MLKYNLFKEVTDRVIEALSQGVLPWRKPWRTLTLSGLPENIISRKPYRGINIVNIMLECILRGWDDYRFMTYNQGRERGVFVRKGEHGVHVFYRNSTAKEYDKPDGTTETRVIPFLKHYTVFNVSQFEGYQPPANIPPVWANHDEIDLLVASTGAVIRHGGDKAAYIPSKDCIIMPPKASFGDLESYYATLLHEVVHWTGSKSRLDRFGITQTDYALEELVAELGAAFLCAYFGIDLNKIQHTSYIKVWLGRLGSDQRYVFTAARLAQSAFDLIVGKQSQDEQIAA